MLARDLPLLPRLELDDAAPHDWAPLAAAAPTALLCTQDALASRLGHALQDHPGLAGVLIVGPHRYDQAVPGTHH